MVLQNRDVGSWGLKLGQIIVNLTTAGAAAVVDELHPRLSKLNNSLDRLSRLAKEPGFDQHGGSGMMDFGLGMEIRTKSRSTKATGPNRMRENKGPKFFVCLLFFFDHSNSLVHFAHVMAPL